MNEIYIKCCFVTNRKASKEINCTSFFYKGKGILC
ncbi:hypothetical protein MTY_1504 [Moorella thermoacetica Y72]|uniref:Uncharacterized protein n=1 Tax=Moorella thermoacetica Y72 TaxID=1325331 RepID=A0A0S6UBQ3_NEOTH|nr:hypothetical protein MTY_1504 [Moorella thermoacetica Y72]